MAVEIRAKIIFIGFIALFLISCSSVQERELQSVSQDTVIFDDFSFDEVWAATLKSMHDIKFVVRKEIIEKGMIDALGQESPSSEFSPPIMNVLILAEDGRIKVSCLVILEGKSTELEKSKGYLKQFFNTVKKNLED